MYLIRREFVFKLVFINSKRHLSKMVRNLLSAKNHNVPILSKNIADKLMVDSYVLH